MSQFEKRPNSGVLFAARTKKTPKSPDYTGEIVVDERSIKIVDGMAIVRISGWKKTSKTGTTFVSLAVDTYERKENAQKQNDDPFGD
ncbi:hypothetical protein EBT31_04905 [bacterium]|jgi:hypothetical protein|nr:hypothetical protein [bacterium]